MKNLKSLYLSLSLITLLSLTGIESFAMNTSSYAEPVSVGEQIHDYLTGIDLSGLDDEREVLVDFILNYKGEIMILSTNDESLDLRIKNRLNYKRIANNELEVHTKYTINVLFKNT